MATSGSCMINTKLTVFAGTLVQSSFGEIGFGSDCVYLAGISAPSANADVVSVSPGRGGGGGVLSCARIKPAKMLSASVILIVCPGYFIPDTPLSSIYPSHLPAPP